MGKKRQGRGHFLRKKIGNEARIMQFKETMIVCTVFFLWPYIYSFQLVYWTPYFSVQLVYQTSYDTIRCCNAIIHTNLESVPVLSWLQSGRGSCVTSGFKSFLPASIRLLQPTMGRKFCSLTWEHFFPAKEGHGHFRVCRHCWEGKEDQLPDTIDDEPQRSYQASFNTKMGHLIPWASISEPTEFLLAIGVKCASTQRRGKAGAEKLSN